MKNPYSLYLIIILSLTGLNCQAQNATTPPRIQLDEFTSVRMRVTTDNLQEVGMGHLVGVNQDTIILKMSEFQIMTIPVAKMSRMEISRGQTNRYDHITTGVLVGGMIGLIGGVLAARDCAEANNKPADENNLVDVNIHFNPGGCFLTGFVLIGFPASLVGGIIGAGVPAEEKWETIYSR